MINSCANRGMKIHNDNFAALHACILPDGMDAAKRLLEQGMDFDSYLEWSEKNHSGEKEENLINSLKEYWENAVKTPADYVKDKGEPIKGMGLAQELNM